VDGVAPGSVAPQPHRARVHPSSVTTKLNAHRRTCVCRATTHFHERTRLPYDLTYVGARLGVRRRAQRTERVRGPIAGMRTRPRPAARIDNDRVPSVVERHRMKCPHHLTITRRAWISLRLRTRTRPRRRDRVASEAADAAPAPDAKPPTKGALCSERLLRAISVSDHHEHRCPLRAGSGSAFRGERCLRVVASLAVRERERRAGSCRARGEAVWEGRRRVSWLRALVARSQVVVVVVVGVWRWAGVRGDGVLDDGEAAAGVFAGELDDGGGAQDVVGVAACSLDNHDNILSWWHGIVESSNPVLTPSSSCRY